MNNAGAGNINSSSRKEKANVEHFSVDTDESEYVCDSGTIENDIQGTDDNQGSNDETKNDSGFNELNLISTGSNNEDTTTFNKNQAVAMRSSAVQPFNKRRANQKQGAQPSLKESTSYSISSSQLHHELTMANMQLHL